MEFLLEYGYIGLFIGAFLAATILPMSSDVLLVGLLAVGADPYISVAVATAGSAVSPPTGSAGPANGSG